MFFPLSPCVYQTQRQYELLRPQISWAFKSGSKSPFENLVLCSKAFKYMKRVYLFMVHNNNVFMKAVYMTNILLMYQSLYIEV